MSAESIKYNHCTYNLQSWAKQKGLNPVPIEKADGIYTVSYTHLIWITALFVLWEVCAAHVAETKRTPENILPHISGIINSLLSDKKINGSQTALQMVLELSLIHIWQLRSLNLTYPDSRSFRYNSY